ncbi:MAG TPA: hypothetical protein VLK22_02500 [Candidatus Udaeobacter sp.]|nr:hypothetical protein [Candidatus Udaeobacter sp.]
MPTNLCDAWNDLLIGRYLGQTYDILEKNRGAYSKHLISCETCRQAVEPWLVWPAVRPEELGNLTTEQYLDVLRDVAAFARGHIPKKYAA